MARHLGEPVLLLDPSDGPPRSRRRSRTPREQLGCDLVVLTDVGGDVLAHGDEAGLGSPLADAVCLAAAPRLAERGVARARRALRRRLRRRADARGGARAAGRGRGGGRPPRRLGPGSAELERLEAAVARDPDRGQHDGPALRPRRLGSVADPRRAPHRAADAGGGLVFFFDPLVALRSAARCARLVARRELAGGGQRDPARARDRDRARLGVGAAAASQPTGPDPDAAR